MQADITGLKAKNRELLGEVHKLKAQKRELQAVIKSISSTLIGRIVLFFAEKNANHLHFMNSNAIVNVVNVRAPRKTRARINTPAYRVEGVSNAQ